jgi:molybdate transport system substrate-binding protein
VFLLVGVGVLGVLACAPAANPDPVATSPTGAAAGQPAAKQQALTGSLTVLAAASLTDAFNELQQMLKADNPQLDIRISYAASSQLRTQIQNGVPFDIFASADTIQMQPVATRGLVGQPQEFVRNELVVIVPRANPARIESFRDIDRPGLRFVTTAPQVPIGNFTRQALEKASRDPAYGAGFGAAALRNVVSEEDNVRQVLNKVQLGEADLGIVYRSDVTPRSAQDVTVIDIPAQFNVIASYPIAIAQRPENPVAAEAWCQLVFSERGQAVFRKFNFTPVR